ncbi:MAG: hypothetical protein KZQ66_06080 [Candidatus Thiodiazotropha sp. (ex Lucinoma aequizonata)]|nr:hypothetical protein [Candidatus Thiodiazotropha sp. (ex Lucinoma aequizonata)]MCU7901610.1 hypothetical protein [Candidatus Thiodiazotropha sp. (ex Lucinoma aequizonata)]MCU7909368.1 hypothetical protein [Candidatus Thiodiazotropha sp. (ex Lucinoma aequizonata)]MCU7912972.1 hypothetical protein [Candidatus Thiodiazotropha sp. (ex Lucinoma aequizonata)]
MKKLRNVMPTALLIVLATGTAPSIVQSVELPDRGPIPFATYDTGANGSISEAEFNAVRSKRMKSNAAEGRQMRGAATEPAFDANGDGKLTANELAAGQQVQMRKRHAMCMGQGRGRGKERGRAMGRNMPKFSNFDLNGDGKLLKDEFIEARGQRIADRAKQGYQMRNLGNMPAFADIDTNENGEVSPQEFAAHQSRCRDQMKQ